MVNDRQVYQKFRRDMSRAFGQARGTKSDHESGVV
jgi:hypothetical protein